ncbi:MULTISPECIES: GNAT family N-acetyltransferase [unclassified Gemella]|uniref:GNAT family N-acetyltransferase n=1 Tax=unclassified Gemella TaxID=2624949 RepID=UPI001ADDDB1C|nr:MULTISPECIES: GNAT family N-acetyltransferase [unclassified Gemella]
MVKDSDSTRLLEIYSYYVEKTNISFEYGVPSEEEFKDRIRNISSKYPYIVAEKNGIVLGYAYANTFKERTAYNWTVEWSIYLDKNYSAKGLGQILLDKLIEILKMQNIVTIQACITYPNEKSIIFHEKNSFKKVAHFTKVGYKFGKWHDVVWYEKALTKHEDNPGKVKWIGEIDVEF